MKKLLSLIMFAASLTASADDFSLYYDITGGTQNNQAATVAELQKIIFDHEGNMIIEKKDGSQQTISIASASRIYFSTPATVDIKQIGTDELTDKGDIYDLCGRKLSKEQGQNLRPGIYIVNGKKIYVK